MEVTCANPHCARVFTFTEGPAHFARRPQHYCSRSCQNTTHGRAGTPQHRLWEMAKRRAKRNGTDFALRLEDIPEVPVLCPVLGIRLQPNDVAGPIDSSPSLDRIQAKLGYVPGNVRVISFRANRLRSDASADELRAVADDAKGLQSP